MINIVPSQEKKLFFYINYQGINLNNSSARLIIPISDDLCFCIPGQITNEGISFKITPINVNLISKKKTTLTLEVITPDNEYFKVYEDDVNFEITEKIITVTEVEELDLGSKITSEKKKSKLRSILE